MKIVVANVDYNRLRRSNDLAWKWFDRTKLHKNKYINWVLNLKKNPQEFKDTLSPSMKSAFSKDLKELFYAAEIEDALVSQYVPLVHHILKKVSYRQTHEDELLSIGFIAIRNAVWQYRNVGVKCGFTTYCHSSVYMRITGEISKLKTIFRRRAKKCTMTLYSDINNDIKFNDIAVCSDEDRNSETAEILNKTIELMNLKSEEKYLFNLLINRAGAIRGQEVWYQPYLNNCKKSFPNGKLTKEAVRLRVLKLQKNFWINWHIAQGLDVPVMPKPKMAVAI
jgi:DNA-directed RNA polymerase specialized sigma subunit